MDNSIADSLYEQVKTLFIKSQVEKIEKEIESKKKLIEKIKNGPILCSGCDENSVSDVEDQKLIIYDAHTKLKKKEFDEFSKKCQSMFMHADNVRSVYEWHKLELPSWFSEKYGHLFAEK